MHARSRHSISNDMPLLPSEILRVSFPAPTNHLLWRAEVGGVGQRQISFKRGLKRIWFFRPGQIVLHPGYTQTEWMQP